MCRIVLVPLNSRHDVTHRGYAPITRMPRTHLDQTLENLGIAADFTECFQNI